MIEENVVSQAGAHHSATEEELRRLIRDAGRIPAERSTTYEIRRQFGREEDDHFDPLDRVEGESEDTFGSYARLSHSPEWKFKDRYEIPLTPVAKGWKTSEGRSENL